MAMSHGMPGMTGMSSMASMQMGTPWLDQPVMLHSDRTATCTLTPEQCAYRNYPWRFWYIADWVYGLNTVYFCIAVIALFVLGRLAVALAPVSLKSSPWWKKSLSSVRFLSSRSYRIPYLHWYSAPLGVILLGLLGFVFFMAMTLGPQPYYWQALKKGKYGSSPPLATRAGWMALGLLPFVIALPTKLNLITAATGISHENLQVFHRWTAYAMFVLALVHTFPFIVIHINAGDMVKTWQTSVFYWTGVVALLAQLYLTAFSWGPIRHRFYEFFKATHMVAAVIFLVFFFIHCDFRLSSWDYFIATGVIYALSFLGSYLRTFQEHGLRDARVKLLSNGYLRIAVAARTSTKASEWFPGQHVFLRFLIFPHVISSHPFTICSLEESNEMVFFVKAHKGLTGHLARSAAQNPAYSCKVMIDGAYGGLRNEDRTLCDYDKNIIVAGGSGAGFVLPLVEDILRRRTWDRCHTALSIIISTRELETQDWIRDEINAVFRKYKGAFTSEKMPTIYIHLTSGAASSAALVAEETGMPLVDKEKDGPIQQSAELSDASSNSDGSAKAHQEYLPHFELRTGRRDLKATVKSEFSKSTGSLGVAVCGPASMIYDVSNAVADVQMDISKGRSSCTEVYLHTEQFGL